MTDDRCRITVVGQRRQVDLAVPAHAPIAEYAPMLAELCGQDESDAMPPAWSLAPVGGPPLRPEASLESAGVADGETLYLHDLLQGEFAGPEVSDIEERVAELDEDGSWWNARARANTTVGLGLVLLLVAAVAAAVVSAVDGWTEGTAALSPLIFATGVATALLAWNAGRKHWPVPPVLRLTLASATCPLMACSVLALPLPGAAARVLAASVAASAGALVAYLAAPSPATMVLQIGSWTVTLPAVPLALLGADAVQSAALVAVVAFQATAALPRVASTVATLPPGSGAMDGDDVAATLRRVQRLLIFLNTVCCLAITVAFIVLNTSRDWFALGLVLCLSLAMLCRATTSRLWAVVAAVLLSGVAGLAGLALRAPGRIFGSDLPGSAAPLVLLAVGVLVLWGGLAMSFRSSLQQVEFDERWTWPGPLGTFLGALSVPLAAGVFGVIEALLDAGLGT